ncbi:MAG: ATP-grasp domain-containing protein [Minisyncoccia bacterium]
MRILILYNDAKELKKGIPSDLICEQEIMIIAPLVEKSLRERGYEVETLKATYNLWEDLKKRKNSIDLVLNLSEGFGGCNVNETFVPSMLEALEIPFTGASSQNMHFTLDKEKTNIVLERYGIPTPSHQLFRNENEQLRANMSFPLIVKPVREEGSVGIYANSVVSNKLDLQLRIAEILERYKQPALVEKFIDGREISVGIIGNKPDFRVFPPLEFLFKEAKSSLERIRSYEYKWGGKKEQMVRAELPERIIKRLKEYSCIAYIATECRDYARMDFRVSGDKIYILEANYNPGIGPNTHGLNNTLTMMAGFEGSSFEDLVENVIKISAKRCGIHK